MIKKLEVTFTWENENFFLMTAKKGTDGEEIGIVEVKEDACIKSIWRHIADLCVTYVTTQLHEIGDEMMQ